MTTKSTNDEGSLALGSKAFQEATGRETFTEQTARFVRSLKDPATGQLKADLAQPRNCPICDTPSESSRILFNKDGFLYRACATCGFTYVAPMLREDVLESLYADSDYAESWMKVLLNPVEQRFNKPKFDSGVAQLESLIGRKGHLLEIGSGVGQFLSSAKQAGWEAVGVELNDSEREYCHSQGHTVLGDILSPDSFEASSFDAVAMWEVLEHIADPRAIVRMVHRFLKPDGAFLIVVPNVDSLAARVLQEKCNMFLGISHISMFTPNTLNTLLAEEGFHLEEMSTFISEISILNNYLQYEHPYTGQPEGLLPLFDTLDEKFIHDNLLGYKIKAIYKKD